MKQTLTQKLATLANSITFETMEKEQIHMMKRFVLDYLGANLAGVPVDSSQTAVSALLNMPGEKRYCTVIGHTQKQSPFMAALINGTLAHTVEMDDDHREAIMHSGVVVIPAALAAAEQENSSGGELLAAVMAGYEVVVRVGNAFKGRAMYAGWHPTGTCGVFGAATAAGKLLGLDATGLERAYNIAGSMSSGLFEFKSDGSWTKRFHAGKAQISGLIAATLAKEGYRAPLDILDGSFGFFPAYSNQGDYDTNLVDGDIGQRFTGLLTSIKPYACGRFAQPTIDCALDLTLKYDLHPEDIKEVLVRTDHWTAKAYGTPYEKVYHPQTTVDSQFSIPYAAAVAICRRKARLQEFSAEAIADPLILETAAKVRYVVDEEIEKKYPLFYPCGMTIWTNDGRELSTYIDYPLGDPENPISDAGLVEKFADISQPAISDTRLLDLLVDNVWQLDQLDDVHRLTALLY